jgi:hypothetical protein
MITTYALTSDPTTLARLRGMQGAAYLHLMCCYLQPLQTRQHGESLAHITGRFMMLAKGQVHPVRAAMFASIAHLMEDLLPLLIAEGFVVKQSILADQYAVTTTLASVIPGPTDAILSAKKPDAQPRVIPSTALLPVRPKCLIVYRYDDTNRVRMLSCAGSKIAEAFASFFIPASGFTIEEFSLEWAAKKELQTTADDFDMRVWQALPLLAPVFVELGLYKQEYVDLTVVA